MTNPEFKMEKKVSEFTGETFYVYRGFEIYQNKRESSGYYGRWYVGRGRLHSDSTRDDCVKWIDRHIPEKAAEEVREAAKSVEFERRIAVAYEGSEVVPVAYRSKRCHYAVLCQTPAFRVQIEWEYEIKHYVDLNYRALSTAQVAELAAHLQRAAQIATMETPVIASGEMVEVAI